MTILFLHLSDLHFDNNGLFGKQKVNSLKDTIELIYEKEKIDVVFIVFSGDITMSGKKYQFDGVKRIIDKIKNNIELHYGNNNNVYIFIVPGNHDIDFNNISYTRDDIRYKIKEDNKLITNEYLNNLTNFFEYSKCYNNFNNDNKIVDYKMLFCYNIY